MQSILIDAGPLIALFNNRDKHHKRVVDYLAANPCRLVTSWLVVTEVSYMLGFSIEAQIDFLKWIEIGGLEILDLTVNDISKLIDLTRKYSDLPMDIADGSLILLAQRMDSRQIISIDSDYQVYCIGNEKYFENVLG
ncbi:MAG: PIN domain-containing protein [Spirochaetales bacterium]|nr:PIN domain-containing protein [Spirochaetales bacterium]